MLKIFLSLSCLFLLIDPSRLSSSEYPQQLGKVNKRESTVHSFEEFSFDVQREENKETLVVVDRKKREDMELEKMRLGPLVKTKPEDLEKEKKEE